MFNTRAKKVNSGFGRYKIIQPIGEGGMALVHLAQDPVLDRLVAIKEIKSTVGMGREAYARFEAEAKVVAALRSGNIVEIYDFGLNGTNPYFVMEFVDGMDALKLIKLNHCEGLPEIVAMSILLQAAEGMKVAHRMDVIHRDLKPENMLINSYGNLKISDFGIARIGNVNMTQGNRMMGTPAYMSPEQCISSSTVTFASDLFSLGAVFYHLLTGHEPFQGTHVMEIVHKVQHEPYEVLSNSISPELAQIVNKLLSKNAQARYYTASTLCDTLRRILMQRNIADPQACVKNFTDKVASHQVGQSKTASEFDIDRIEKAVEKATGRKWSANSPAKNISNLHKPSRYPIYLWSAMGLILLLSASYFFWFGKFRRSDDPQREKQPINASQPSIQSRVQPIVQNAIQTSEIIENVPNHPPVPQIVRSPTPVVKKKSQSVNSGIQSAQVTISSTPTAADIYFNGIAFGITPVKNKSLAVGKAHFQVIFGSQIIDTIIEIKSGQQSLHFNVR